MEDLKKLKVKNWKETAKDRRTWRDLTEKAKTHKGLKCQMLLTVRSDGQLKVAHQQPQQPVHHCISSYSSLLATTNEFALKQKAFIRRLMKGISKKRMLSTS